MKNLETWPITITTKAQDMVKGDGTLIDMYKPFFSLLQKEERLDKHLPKLETKTTIKIVKDVLGRGPDYAQERKEKDEQQIGFDSPLNLEDLPAMACINPRYEKNQGPNYYGDTHFVLDPKVRKRSAFSYATDSPERRSFYLLLNDILSKDLNKFEQICKGKYELQDIEVHVYGNVDLKKDIIEFHLGDPNMLSSADIKSSKVKGIFSNSLINIKGNPTEKLKYLKSIFKKKDIETLADIWIKKQKGTEMLKNLIGSLPSSVKSNLEKLGAIKAVDKDKLTKEEKVDSVS
ncbi:MAG: hypothetical protein AAF934_11835 [Bacteroidota bacterium]